MTDTVAVAYIEDILRAVEAETEQRLMMADKELFTKADSMLSYIRHRANITNWKTPGFGLTEQEMDELIGTLRRRAAQGGTP